MDWVPKPNLQIQPDQDDAPRLLTRDEINNMVERFPAIRGSDPTATEVSRNELIKWLSDELRAIPICPSAIPELTEILIEKHYRSVVHPGTPVGINAAEAIGATTTQMTLNSVDWEEVVYIKQGMNIILGPIGKFIDNIISISNNIQLFPNDTQYVDVSDQGYEVTSVDEDGKMHWKKLEAVTRHLPGGKLVKVVTKTGRSVRATKSKSFLVCEDGKIVPREGSLIKIGDKVPIVWKSPKPDKVDKRIATTERIVIGDPNEIYDCIGHFLGINALGKSLGCPFEIYPTYYDACMGAETYMRIGQPSRITECDKGYRLEGFGPHLRDQINDIFLDEIISIEEVDSTHDKVYDLTVADTRNFTIFGGLCVRDTFHRSGQAKTMSLGVDAMRELIFARQNRKFNNSTIYFKDKTLTFDDVLDKKVKIVGSVVSDFVKNWDIDSPDELEHYWWHDIYEMIMGKSKPRSSQVLRLFLNVNELYAHKVTMEMIADLLETDYPKSVVVVHSPLVDGVLDIYPEPKMMAETLKVRKYMGADIAERVFLNDIVLPSLDKLRVKGIPGIRRLFPVKSPVWQIVLEEKKVPTEDRENMQLMLDQYFPQHKDNLDYVWRLTYNKRKIFSSGVKPENLAALVRAADYDVLGSDDDSLVIVAPRDGDLDEKPGDRVARLFNEHRKIEEDYVKEQREAGVKGIIRAPRSALSKAYEYVYADTDGKNLVDLLSHPDVDATRSFCNNIHDIAKVLGIEAARSFFIKDLSFVIEMSESYVNPHHIMLLADFITCRGAPAGITYTGISRQPVGHIALSTLERAMEVMSTAGLYGKSEDIRSTSASVAVARRMALGTGSFDIDVDEKMRKEHEQRMTELEAARDKDMDIIDANAFAEGLDALDAFVDDAIDRQEGEDDNDLAVMFNRADMITGLPTGVTPDARQFKAPPIYGPGEGNVADIPTGQYTKPVIGKDIQEAVNEINRGIKLTDTGRAKFTIKPLAGGVKQELPKIFEMEGVPEREFTVIGTGLPQDLLDLMGGIGIPAPEIIVEGEGVRPVFSPGLPAVEVRTLPKVPAAEVEEELFVFGEEGDEEEEDLPELGEVDMAYQPVATILPIEEELAILKAMQQHMGD